jgi:ribosomal protein S27E
MARLYRNAILVVIGAGVVILSVTALMLWPRPTEPGDCHFMHCSVCDNEMVYSAALSGKRCPRCKPPNIGYLIPTRKSVNEGGRSPYRQIVGVLMFESIFVLGALVFLLYHPPPPPEAKFYYTFCPNRKCKRKMRYSANRAGMAAQCPVCKSMVVNPTVEEQELLERLPLE